MVCETVTSWGDMFYCISPYSWAYAGIGLAITFSIIGAVWGIFLTGASIMGAAVRVPRVTTKNLVSVVFCEAVAIYGVIMAIIMNEKIEIYSGNIYSDPEVYKTALYAGCNLFWIGFLVGVSNIVCGVSVGVTGSSCVLVDAQEPSTFIKMLIVEIFGSALGLFGLIIGVMQLGDAVFPS